jgi:hypothetical protein
MSDGIYIKTPPLTAKDAALAVQLIQTIKLPIGEAEHGLRIIGSLVRIANGVDTVTETDASAATTDQ